MNIRFEDDNILVINEKQQKYMIKKEHITGTLIYNYFVYGCYADDDYEYFITEYATLEEALKDCFIGFID